MPLRQDPAPTMIGSIGHMTQTRHKDNRSADDKAARAGSRAAFRDIALYAASLATAGRTCSSAIQLIMRPSIASTPRVNNLAISEATSGVG
jgi:hypothetical protein